MTHLLSLLLTWGCSAPEPAGDLRLKAGDAHHATKRAADDPDADSDGDGVRNADDCEPHDRYSFPGANEHCDGIDNDCDGTVDFGTRALRLRPGDVLTTSAPTAVLGPGRDPLTLSFRIRIDGQANRTIEWVGDGVGYATNFVEAINFPRLVLVPEDASKTHETQNRDSLLPARWTHVALVFQPGTEESDARVVLYLDGVRYNPATLPSEFDTLDLTATNHLRLSADGATGDIWIDELRFWRRTANRTNILPRMCGDLKGDEPDLLAYFPFEADIHDHGPHRLELNVVSGTPQLMPF